jgi:hypothetical protein
MLIAMASSGRIGMRGAFAVGFHGTWTGKASDTPDIWASTPFLKGMHAPPKSEDTSYG